MVRVLSGFIQCYVSAAIIPPLQCEVKQQSEPCILNERGKSRAVRNVRNAVTHAQVDTNTRIERGEGAPAYIT